MLRAARLVDMVVSRCGSVSHTRMPGMPCEGREIYTSVDSGVRAGHPETRAGEGGGEQAAEVRPAGCRARLRAECLVLCSPEAASWGAGSRRLQAGIGESGTGREETGESRRRREEGMEGSGDGR